MRTLLANLAPHHPSTAERPEYSERMQTPLFPLGLGLIASVLQSRGFPYSTYDSYVGGSLPGFFETIEDEAPDVLMLSGFFGNWHYPFIEHVAREVKTRSPQTQIILGGPMASTIPHLLAKHTDIDYIVVGEGEDTVAELMEALREGRTANGIRGVFLGREHGRTFAGPRARIQTLRRWPEYDAFPVAKYIEYLNTTGKCWEVSTSRGCWGRCRFCKLTFGQEITTYPLEDVVDHLRYVVERYGIARFSFVDDNFLNSPGRVRRFLSLLRNRCPPIAWRFQGRADALTPREIEEMIRLGLFDITFGLESGSQAMLDRYDKKLDLRQAKENLLEIRKMLDFHATFILGGPGENWGTVAETESLIRTLRLHHAYIGLLTLFPGTALYEEAIQSGLISDEDVYCRSIGPIFEHVYTNMSELSDVELVTARDRLTTTAQESSPGRPPMFCSPHHADKAAPADFTSA